MPTLTKGPAGNATPTNSSKTLLATGGLLGALLASSCCLLPLTLTILGVSGAWMGSLRALAPYQPLFLALSVAFLGYGFYLVYGKARSCQPNQACARTLPDRLVKTLLWAGLVLIAASVSFPLWFGLIEPLLP